MQQRTGNKPAKKKPARVSLPLVPPKGSPFAGISGTHAPARNTSIPNLTEHVAIAKARVDALKNAGLVPEAKREAAQQAQAIIEAQKRTPQPRSKPLAAKSPALPAWLTKPAVALDQPPTNRTPAAPSPPSSAARRGASPSARGYTKPRRVEGGGLPSLGDIGHVANLGAGTLFNAANIENLAAAKFNPVTRLAEIRKEGVMPLNEAAALSVHKISNVGAQGRIPTSFKIPSIDLVAPAGAAGPNRPITADEYRKLESQGYDLKPRLKKKFTAMALKNGHTPAELEGASGGALIDAAFTKPAPHGLRELGNFGKGIANLGTLPAGIEGAVRETAAGHGLKVAQALGEGLYSELPIVGKHPFVQTLQADPFNAITQFAGVGKTVGAVGRVGRAGNVLREVRTASSGLKVNRGLRSRNAWDATGQMISDTAAAKIPRIGERLEAEVIDKAVRRKNYQHAPEYVAVQRPYAQALNKVGHKRAAELSGYQMAGGKPEQLAAFYRAQGNADNAKFFDRVAASTKTLTEKDKAFMNAHDAVAGKTTQSLIDVGKFGPTAAKFRRYSPLIRSSAHLGDPNAQRILGLREDYLKAFNVLPEGDVAALRGAFDQSVEDFAKQHIKAGGKEPTYVEYSQPKPLIAPSFKPGPGATTGFKTPRGRQKVETGASFESGKYLIDPKAPLVENVRAQRAHLASALHEDVAKAVGQHLKAGDPIPTGHVFVSETNLRGLKRTTNDLADNPVSADAYAEFANQKQGIFDRLKGASVPSGESVPRGEKGYAIPIGSWKRILDHTRPPSRSAYDRFIRQYQRVLISYRPSTIVNNTVGSLPLAVMGGANRPKPYRQAIEAMRDPALAPAVLRGHGVAGSLAPDVRSHVGGGMDFMRRQSVKGEDFSRLATFFSKAGPHIKKQAKALNMDAKEYQRQFAAGKIDTEHLDKFLDHTEQFIGEMLRPDGKLGRAAGKTILFHNWVGHIAKLLLFTLPVKHPRRLMLLQALSAYGNQYRQEHGVWPDWYSAYLPLFQHVERIGPLGKPQTFTKTFSTAGVNPFSTLNNFANPISTNESLKNILIGLSAPPIQIAANTIFNRPYDSKSPARYFLGQTVRQIPGVSVVRPQGGMAPDSIPFISEQQKVYSSGHKVNGKSVPLPYDFRAGARAQGGILGALERYAVGGFYDVPAQGPIHAIDQKKHIGAMAKAARKNR